VRNTVGPDVLARLLDVQEEDTAIRLLDHRRATLPEAERLAEVDSHLAELDADIDIAQRQRADVAREQSRLEGEIDLLDRKIEREEQRLFSGKVGSPRELSSLQAEVQMLKARRGQLEDALLEAMVAREQLDETLGKLQEERTATAFESAELLARVTQLRGEIDAGRSAHAARRSELAAELPADLLSLYDRTRAQKGGVGAAALIGGTCQGCHTKLPAREVERLKAEGGLQRCDSCRRILVVLQA
jgi:predicted  nucleic acid-binding Zn-ribbon protein